MPLTEEESQKFWMELLDAISPIVSRYTTRKPLTLEDVKKAFPTDLEPMFNFEDKDEYFKVTPRQYLGSENFAKAAQIVRFQLRGDYVSAGKDSHFRIPKNKT